MTSSKSSQSGAFTDYKKKENLHGFRNLQSLCIPQSDFEKLIEYHHHIQGKIIQL